MAQSLQVKKVGWWHERLCDWMLANPEKTLGEAAEFFNCSRSHLSIIKNSDSFKLYWDLRSAEYSDSVTDKSVATLVGVKEKAGAAAELALDEINRRLEGASEVIPTQQLLDISKVGLAALGYGAKAPGAPSTQVNVNIGAGLVSAEELKKARERVFAAHGIKAEEPAAEGRRALPEAPIEGSYEVVES